MRITCFIIVLTAVVTVLAQGQEQSIDIEKRMNACGGVKLGLGIVAGVAAVVGAAAAIPTGGASLAVGAIIVGGCAGLGAVAVNKLEDEGVICDESAKTTNEIKKVIQSIEKDQKAHKSWMSSSLSKLKMRLDVTSKVAKDKANAIKKYAKAIKNGIAQSETTKKIISENAMQLRQQAAYLKAIADNSPLMMISTITDLSGITKHISNAKDNETGMIKRQMKTDKRDLNWNAKMAKLYSSTPSFTSAFKAFSKNRYMWPETIAKAETKKVSSKDVKTKFHADMKKEFSGIRRDIQKNAMMLSSQIVEQTAQMEVAFSRTANHITGMTGKILTAMQKQHWEIKQIQSSTEVINANILLLYNATMNGINALSEQIKSHRNLTILTWEATEKNFKKVMDLLHQQSKTMASNFNYMSKELKHIKHLIRQTEMIGYMSKVTDLSNLILRYTSKVALANGTVSSVITFERNTIVRKCRQAAYDPGAFLRLVKREILDCRKCPQSQIPSLLYKTWRKSLLQAMVKGIYAASFCMKNLAQSQSSGCSNSSAQNSLPQKYIVRTISDYTEDALDVIMKTKSVEELHYGQWWHAEIRNVYAVVKQMKSETEINDYFNKHHKNNVEVSMSTDKVFSVTVSSPNGMIPGYQRMLEATNAINGLQPSLAIYCCDTTTQVCQKQLDHEKLLFCPYTTVWYQKVNKDKHIVLNWRMRPTNATSEVLIIKSLSMFYDTKFRRGFSIVDFSLYVDGYKSAFDWLKEDFQRFAAGHSSSKGNLTVQNKADTKWKMMISKESYCWWNNLRFQHHNATWKGGCESGKCNWTSGMKPNGNIMSVQGNTDKKLCCQLCHLFERCYAAMWDSSGNCTLTRNSTQLIPAASGHIFAAMIYQDKCFPNPCKNGAKCFELVHKYQCGSCTPGFTGTHCEQNINECASNPCQNNGTCIDKVNGFVCKCAPGYNGTLCKANINECASNPCGNGGTCIDKVNGYVCKCAPGYNGTLCKTNINECASNPCQNGGRCTDKVNGFVCKCAPGYGGATCKTNINECSPNPCQNGGTCTDKLNGFVCTCGAAYYGTTCEKKDKCEPYCDQMKKQYPGMFETCEKDCRARCKQCRSESSMDSTIQRYCKQFCG